MTKTNLLLFFLCFFLFVFKIISIKLTDFDLFGDEAQYWLWSKNIDLGYYSKPPLLPWIIGIVSSIFGNSFFVIKMIPIVAYCLTSYVIFLISKKIINNNELAIFTSMAFFLMPAASFSSFFISTDVFLIFFWALALLQLLIIKNNPTRINYILLGIILGLAFLTKYAAIYFIFSFSLMFFNKEMKQAFYKNKKNISLFLLSFVLVIAPNIIWNLNNKWLTLNHTLDNIALEKFGINILGGIVFVFSQIIMIGPIIFIFFLFYFRKNLKFDFYAKFLIFFSFPIFFIIFLESLLIRANANWAAVSLISFMILFVHGVFKFNKKVALFNSLVNLFVGCVLFYLIASNSSLESFNRIRGVTYFANSLFDYQIKPINNLVISDRMLFSNLNYILRERGIKMYVPYSPGSAVGHHFQISNSLPPEFNNNFIFIGHKDQIKYLKNKHTTKHLASKKVLFNNETLKIYEVVF